MLSFIGGSVVKNPPVNAGDTRDTGSIPGSEDPLEKGMTTHSSILAWRIPWTEEPGGLHSIGSRRVGHDWATKQQLQQWDIYLILSRINMQQRLGDLTNMERARSQLFCGKSIIFSMLLYFNIFDTFNKWYYYTIICIILFIVRFFYIWLDMW